MLEKMEPFSTIFEEDTVVYLQESNNNFKNMIPFSELFVQF